MENLMNNNELPKGFICAGISAGIKPDNVLDMGLIVSEPLAIASGVFTTNQVCAAPVKLCKKHLEKPYAKAILVNSGIANACTGSEGKASAMQLALACSKKINCSQQDILVCSTGKIGSQLPVNKMIEGIDQLLKKADTNQLDFLSQSIMTTDTHPKKISRTLVLGGEEIKIVGIAKGAGMIEPNMATMLAFILTDAKINSINLQTALKDAVDHSFNRITIDGDQSTNDSVLILANGAANQEELSSQSEDWLVFTKALYEICFELAMMIVHDGEGADRFVTLHVTGAISNQEADAAARSVANSLLNKTAWAGSYPDWGRIMDAIGYSSAKIIEENTNIFYGDVQAAKNGCQSKVDHKDLVSAVSAKELLIKVDLGLGKGNAVIYTCNCTERYVRINY